MDKGYWDRRRLSRRRVLRGGALGILGLGAAALIGCGDDDDDDSSGTPSTSGTPSGSATPAPTPVLNFKRGGIIRMGTEALATGLDPHFSGAGYHKTRTAFDTLLDLDAEGVPTVAPDALASSIEQVDETTLVVKLKEGVIFHDRTPFNAEAVVWNIDRELQDNPPAGTPHSGEIRTTERLEAVDEHTVRWILSQPDSAIFGAFASHSTEMLSPTHYEGPNYEDTLFHSVGTGRYMFKDYSQDAFIKYEVFPDYFHKLEDGGPAGMVDEIHELAIPDAVARASGLINGDLEVLDESPPEQIDLLESSDSVSGVKSEGFAIRNAYINHALPPLDNVDVRRALMWAWDADAYNNVYDNNIGTPATSYLSRIHRWAHIDVPEHPGFDLDMAQMFIERSGVPESERHLKIGGNTIAFQFVQAAWEKIGFTSEHIADTSGRLTRARGDTNLDVHMTIGSRITSRAEPAWQTDVMLRSDSIYNYGWAPTGDIDELSDRARRTYDLEERKELYAQIQHIHADQLYAHFTKVEIPFWIHSRNGVAGARHYANGRGDYRYMHFTV